MLWKIDGYLVIPHELLHVLAYWLIGKKCYYRFGSHSVKALETRSLKERLFVLLFPLFVVGGSGFLLIFLWTALYLINRYPANPLIYFQVAPLWHKAMWALSIILLLYSGSSVNDVRATRRLLWQKLRNKPPNHPKNHKNKGKKPHHPN